MEPLAAKEMPSATPRSVKFLTAQKHYSQPHKNHRSSGPAKRSQLERFNAVVPFMQPPKNLAMTHALLPQNLLAFNAGIDLPVLMDSCTRELNRLARQPVLIRRDSADAQTAATQIELVFGMDQLPLAEVPMHEWLRTEHDAEACADLVQQIKTLFAVPAWATVQLNTAQMPA